jgi:hypothetical protein
MTLLQSIGGILIVSGVLIVAAQVRKQDAAGRAAPSPHPEERESASRRI